MDLHSYSAPFGELILGIHEGNLCLCDWTDSRWLAKNLEQFPALLSRPMQILMTNGSAHYKATTIEDVKSQLDEYFSRERRQFDLPVALYGTKCQINAWKALLTIPYGTTVTYSQLASLAGFGKGYQAIGSAVSRNPISVILPCHRVISTNGLGGYASGLPLKISLLTLESPHR